MPTLHCILGRVSASGGVVVTGKPAPNSSKWIFDVRHEAESGAEAKAVTFEVHLLDYISAKPRPRGIYSPHASPLNEGAARARIWFPDPDRIAISCAPRPATVLVLFRVTVDALHTLMR